MGEGLKKYFNGSTMSGRANVAKATYAALAVFYLIYRVRRGGKGEPPAGDALMQPNCSCDEKPGNEPMHEPERDCTVCRERRPRDDCPKDPPPPPPPAAPARRKCPCEDPHRHQDNSKPPTHQSMQQQPVAPQPQLQQHQQPPGYNENEVQVDEAHPAREIITQVHEAASRVLRNVILAVLGDATTETEGAGNRTCGCCKGSATCTEESLIDANDAAEDELNDYESESGLFNRQRRTAPRSCVPNNTSSAADLAEEGEDSDVAIHLYSESNHPQSSSPNHSQPHLQSTSMSQPPPPPPPKVQAHPRYRGFDDDFAAEMFFDNYED